jgi:hypothetical protein
MQLGGLRWGRILGAGVVAELAVFAIVFPVQHFLGQQAFLASILIASFAMPLAGALWVCRRAASQFALHGALVGLVAALFYLIIAWGQTEPLLYKIAHGLKLVGGWLGGLMAARRAQKPD